VRDIHANVRLEWPTVVARIVRDVGVAEELAQDALVTTLETQPRR
jgi:predicted RNA polymerase sigma factor